ncbi:MAG TPA: DeoR/GlpR transcriptional regulator [Candidatus Scybalomonas excrementigallinarum]|jgi:DeoR family transcriptional regulator of aga operon/DeoR family myo-inositol catabolism operon transcriptional repressor|nr:DeoR/GlpR transcriptional regulator [Candidatus Scybalomonas excrementigallinarum]
MLAEERKEIILKQLYEEGKVLVQDLSASINVSTETIRRDLKELENESLLKRVHGGAVLTKKINGELSVNIRKNIFLDSKKIIASKAIKYIVDGSTIFLDSSTTSIEIAEELFRYNHLKVITNSLLIAEILSKNINIHLILIGGNFNAKNFSFIGYAAQEHLNRYLADICFISSTGVNEMGLLVDSSEDEAIIRRLMIEHSENKYYVLDDTKFYRSSTYVIGNLNQFTGILSNKKLPKELTNSIKPNSSIILDDN